MGSSRLADNDFEHGYEFYEWVCMAVSFLIIILYHGHYFWFPHKISVYQKKRIKCWMSTMESNSSQSILGVQAQRNVMATATMLASVSIGAAMLCVTIGSKNDRKQIEMQIVTLVFLKSFFHYAMCCRITHHVGFFISLYPQDLIKREVDKKNAASNERKLDNLTAKCTSHMKAGTSALLIGLPMMLLLISPVAMLGGVLLSGCLWYYLDHHFGIPAELEELLKVLSRLRNPISRQNSWADFDAPLTPSRQEAYINDHA
jgi:hypothetical protein